MFKNLNFKKVAILLFASSLVYAETNQGTSNRIEKNSSMTARDTEVQVFGENNKINGQASSAFGKGNIIYGPYSGAVGLNNVLYAGNSYTIGNNNKVNEENRECKDINKIGEKCNNNYVFGEANKIEGHDNSAFGKSNKIKGNYSGVMGINNILNGSNSYIIGNNHKINEGNDSNSGHDIYAFGEKIIANTGVKDAIVLGKESEAVTNALSIGKSGSERKLVNLKDGEIKDGSHDAVTGSQLHKLANDPEKATGFSKENWKKTLGNGNIEENNTDFVTGKTVYEYMKNMKGTINNNKSLTISGDDKNTETEVTDSEIKVKLKDTITLGSDTEKQVKLNGQEGNVQVGKVKVDGVKAEITGLKNTTWDKSNVDESRAATEGQLKNLAEKGLKFAANEGIEHTVALGDTFTIKGDYSGNNASSKNIKTKIESNVLKIQMSEKPEFDSVKTGNTTIDNNGVSYNGKKYIGDTGLNANNQKITNVVAGTEDTDAVNFYQIKELRKDLSGGIATASAMANIPQVGEGRLVSIGFGAAYYNKQGGFALGISGTEPSRRIVYKLSAGIDTRKDFVVGAGINANFGNLAKPAISSNQSYVMADREEFNKLKNEINELREEIKSIKTSKFEEKLYVIDQFTNDKYVPKNTQIEKLKAIIKEINEKYSDRIIDITGHTDTNANEKYNLDLGLKRANKIVDLMIKLGLKNPQNIRKVSSFGYNNKVNKNLASNRRVEIIIK
ncbi:OmpA family protein [Caviibacter abscessus]|uniref:OmpA family protein n=1 Tax=Caviibacter abscessus TaxID=1766719 RepID=UPI000830C9B4|nr:OmpA family protein [Caviibacter abscessus]